jgi:uncharacterized phage protein (TIGR02218 family)
MKNFSPIAFTSAVVGFPANIVVITRMDGTITRIAESDEPLVVDGDTYAVVAGFQVSAVTHTNNGETPSCQIVAVHGVGATFDSNDLDSRLYDGATVQIYKVDRLNLSSKGLLFTGAVSDVQFDPVERQVVLDVKGPSVAARVMMTRRRSPQCQTTLGSSLCQVNLNDFDVATTVNAIADPFSFTVTGSLTLDARYKKGTLVTSAGKAMEVANWTQATQTIMTYLPCEQFLTAGMSLTLYPGCNRVLGSSEGCAGYFNQLNFQGEPHFLGVAAAAQQVFGASGGPTGV